MQIRHLIVPSLLATLVASPAAFGAVRFVDASLKSGANDGSSWENAYRGTAGLVTAITASVPGDEIWVRAGTYRPTTGTSRTAAFTLKTGVAIYGGFAGGESQVGQRDLIANPTILSGDLLGNDSGSSNIAENSYNVVVGSAALATAILDGFTVRGGNANGSSTGYYDRGGGIKIVTSGSPTIRNCTFTANRCTFGGGAGYILQAGATFVACRFEGNFGANYGGAFDMNTVNVGFERCWFSANSAARAGACETFGTGQTRYTNCVFTANTATGTGGGGALWIGSSGSVTARNSTFVANSAVSTAGCVHNTSGSSTFGNCIFWANTGPGGTSAANQILNNGGASTVTYSVVQGGFTGTGNGSSDPLFVDQAARDFRLASASPAIDSGSNALVPTGTTVDFDGGARFLDDPGVADSGAGTAPIVDRGAYERIPPAPPACPADLDDSGAVDAVDLATLLSGWGTATGDIDGNGTTDAVDLANLLSAWGACPG
ncbi:MAG: right-handed parallel beta-helix repeat-containing protein [Planctomycetota bacterium]